MKKRRRRRRRHHAVSGFSVILNGHGELRTLSLDADCLTDFDITGKTTNIDGRSLEEQTRGVLL